MKPSNTLTRGCPCLCLLQYKRIRYLPTWKDNIFRDVPFVWAHVYSSCVYVCLSSSSLCLSLILHLFHINRFSVTFLLHPTHDVFFYPFISLNFFLCQHCYPFFALFPTSVCFSVWLSICPSVCLSVSLSVCLSTSMSVCLSLRLSIFICLPISVCLSVCLSIAPSSHLSF